MAQVQASTDLRPPRRRRIIRLLAILGLAVVVLTAALLMFVHTPPARRYVISRVTALLEQQNIQFRTDEVRYNLLNLRLSLRNLRIRSQDAPDLPPFAHIDRLTVRLSLRQLLRRRYVLRDGIVEGVTVHYFADETGRDNLPRPPHDPEDVREPLDYLIQDLRVRTARVLYENRAQQIDFALPVSLLQVEGHTFPDRHTVTLDAAEGTLVFQDRTARLDQLTGELELGEDAARLTRVDLVADGAHLALTGTIEQFGDPQVNLVVRGTVDAARASAMAGLDDPVGGAFEIDATAVGSLATPALHGRIRGTNVSFRQLSELDLATTASYDMRETRVTFSDLQLRAPFGQVAGEGGIALAGSDASRVTATVSALDAAPLMQALDLPYIVATRVNGQLQAEWPGLDYLGASGAANVVLTPTAPRASRSVIPLGGRVELTGRAGAIDAVLSGVNAGGAVVNGRLRLVDQRRLDGSARVRIDDIARVVSTAEALLGHPPGALLPTRVAGAVAGTARLGGTVSSPTVSAAINAPALALGGASDLALEADVAYTPALVTIRHLDVQWQEARAHAAGTVGLTGARRLDLTLGADALQLHEVLRAMDQTHVPAAGWLSLDGRVSGTAARPVAAVTLKASNLVAYDEQWGSLTGRVTMTGPEIAVPDLLLDKPQPSGNGSVRGNATYDLDRGRYTMDLEATNVQLLGLSLPDGRQVRGTVQLVAHGAGSVDEPAGGVTLTADPLRIDEYDLGRLLVDARVANRQATVSARAPSFAVNADAVIGTDHPYPATVKARIDRLDLAALPLNLQTPLEGHVSATFEAAGTLDAPEQADATATIEAFDGSWNGQPFSVDAPARLRYADERLAIDTLRLVATDSTVALRGELPLTEGGAPGALDVDARANLATLARYAPAGTNLTGAGELTLTGRVRGTLEAIDPDLTLVVTDGTLVTPELAPGLSDLNVRLRLAEGEATIEQLNANWGAARITATGRLPLDVVPDLPVDIPRRGGPATFSASVQGFDLAEVPGAPQGLGGRVSVSAEMAATDADLAALEGRITFPELQLAFSGLTLEQQQVSAIAVSGGTARVEAFTLDGSLGTVRATGTIGLIGARPLDIDATGHVNVAALAVVTDMVRADGDATLQIAARGTVEAPELDGFIDLADATFVVDEPTVVAEGVAARLDLSGRRMALTRLSGTLNGGRLDGSGHVELGDDGIADVALEVTTTDVALAAPLDLRSLSDATIRLTRRGEEFVVDGQVTLTEAGLTGDLDFDRGLLAAITARRRLDLTEPRSALLERVRFNVDVDTATPIVVDNNLARAEITADLRVIGTPYEPGLAGRLTILEEGVITLNERRYEVERGVITFIDERRILPSFDLLLNTSASRYDITIAVTGTPGETETSLTSDPALPEPDIMAILVTGRTLEEMRGEEFEVAREQVLSYLAGRTGSRLGRGLERATGLSTVRIEPNLIANEADPSARLTVGQELTDNLELIYSTNLTDSSDQIWVAEYDLTRRFQTRTVRQSDNSYRFDFRHDVRFGGQPAPSRVPRRRPVVSGVSIASDGALSEAELHRLLDVDAGAPYDFFAVRKGIGRIEETLGTRGHLQARVRLLREGDDRTVTLVLRVTAGPRIDLVFDGVTPPRRVIDEVRLQWGRGIFDRQRLDGGVDALRAWLMRDNHLQPSVDGVIEELGPEARRVRFRVVPGTRFEAVVLAFEGASGVSPDVLAGIIAQQDLEQQLFTDPVQVTELLERYYREQAYLVAEVRQPRYEFDGTRARIVLEVDEGPRFIVRDMTTSGNAVLAPSELLPDLPVQPGDPFLLFAGENALRHMRDLYWRRGYNDVRTDYELVLDRDAGRVDVHFTIREGPQHVIAGIAVQGTDRTSDRLVREQVELAPDEPLDLSALARSRRNLYHTRAFSSVDIAREELEVDDGPKPVRLNVSVREVQPMQLLYGASYDTERGIGGILDLANHNSLGKARVVGMRSRYDAQLRELRGYISQPSLRYWPIQSIGSLYYRQERNPETETTGRFDIDRVGASIQQERELGDSYVWNYGVRYERAHSVGRGLDGVPASPGTPEALLTEETATVTPLTSTFTRDTRDEVLDATRGSFSSHALAYSPSWLGSDQAYVKYFGQYFHYIPLEPERRERFTNEILRPRFVYAVGVRLGLARGLGDRVPLSERFFAGGSTTIRGFEQNAAGPVGPAGLPIGGAAMLVINNELRVPLVSLFDGVVFSDVGNVFSRVSDISLSDLRHAAGIGLRARTAWFLVRADYGVLLDRRAGERAGRFYFSIGQAF